MVGIRFKEAETSEEFDQIHRLNHRTFAEEIGQHPQTGDRRLIDRFHSANRYFIALDGEQLAGMISVHAGPEFSVTSRLPDASLPGQFRSPLEVRLLAILPEYRNSLLLPGLLYELYRYATRSRCSHLLISGIVERVPMYEKMGFRALGPAVPSGAASFVPMALSLDAPSPEFLRLARLYESRNRSSHAVSLLPGPVEIAPEVTRAFHAPPISHRSRQFLAVYEEMHCHLGLLMSGMHCVALGGSGTLANDAVAANLRAAFGASEGLVLSNGEFGERLIRQATRAGLRFRILRSAWGRPWSFRQIAQALESKPAWLWAVHLETSTGVLNDLSRLIGLCAPACIPVAADCVSSLGAVEIPHAGELFLASSVSGKALGSYAGLAFVFASPEAIRRADGASLCPSFDLAESTRHSGPASTLSSPLVVAACEALRRNFSSASACHERYEHHRTLGRWMRAQMESLGLTSLAAEPDAAPTIATFALPSPDFPRQCLRAGLRIAHESDYLRERNWGQIATMGHLDRAALEPLFASLPALAEAP